MTKKRLMNDIGRKEDVPYLQGRLRALDFEIYKTLKKLKKHTVDIKEVATNIKKWIGNKALVKPEELDEMEKTIDKNLEAYDVPDSLKGECSMKSDQAGNLVETDQAGNLYVEVENIRITHVSAKMRPNAKDWSGKDVLRFQAYKDRSKGNSLHKGAELPVEGDTQVKLIGELVLLMKAVEIQNQIPENGRARRETDTQK